MQGAPSSDPREIPAYTVAEAASLVRVPVSTMTTWIVGRAATRGLIQASHARPKLLAFSHLVEAFVLAAIRLGHGVSLQCVCRAVQYVERELSLKRPLMHVQFKTDGVDLFVDKWGKLVNASVHGQRAMREALASSLRRVDWDRQGLPVRLFPLVRSGDVEEPKSIVIDPERGFGRPALAGKGSRVDVVVARYRAGETIEELARDYGVNVDVIDDAVRCELRAAS